jgi:hypothetical protein
MFEYMELVWWIVVSALFMDSFVLIIALVSPTYHFPLCSHYKSSWWRAGALLRHGWDSLGQGSLDGIERWREGQGEPLRGDDRHTSRAT